MMETERKVLFWTILWVLFLTILAFSTGLFAQDVASVTALGSVPASGQVTCGATPTLLYSTTTSGGATPWGRLSITFQNQSTQAVYIAPRADISTTNAGFLLFVQGHTMTFDRSSGNVAWYCITATSTATVGWTEEK
jgi:hypothetical protein